MKKIILAILIAGTLFMDAQAKEMTFMCDGLYERLDKSGHIYGSEQVSGVVFIYDTIKKTAQHHDEIYNCKETASDIKCKRKYSDNPKSKSFSINRYTLKVYRFYDGKSISIDHEFKGQCQIAQDRAF